MTSFISTVSLLVLVLATGCFTLPIIEEHFSSSTFPSLYIDLTTKDPGINPFDMRSTFDDATTEFPHFHSERTLNEELDFHPSTSANKGEVEENSSRSPRVFDELFTFTTQESLSDLEHKQREYTDLSFTTAEPKDDSDMDKREFEVELTTNYMPSFTLSSSDVSPRLYTSESLTSTEKYTGLLKGDTQREEDEEPKKWAKTEKKVTTTKKSDDKSEEDTKITTKKKSKVHTEDKSEEDTKDSKIPVAQLDQELLKNQPIYPDNIMILEKSTDVVTVLPGKLTKPIKTQDKDSYEHEDEDDHKPKKPLNQGKNPSLPEEKESDY